MTFVTVGNAVQKFNRLLEAIDRLNEDGILDAPLFVQYGSSLVIPKNCTAFSVMPRDEFGRLILEADLIITHGGAGSIGRCLQVGKKPVVVPRRKKFGEHVNDHQIDLVRELESQGRIFAAYDVSDLSTAIRAARDSGTTQDAVVDGAGVLVIVRDYLTEISDSKKGAFRC